MKTVIAIRIGIVEAEKAVDFANKNICCRLSSDLQRLRTLAVTTTEHSPLFV
jgi:hypothetical protein